MLILGIHAGMNRFEEEDDYESFALHDSAAVLIRDGEVVTGIEEERLDRIKHSNCFPVRAIQFCLECSKCSLEDVDLIAINLSEARAEIAAKLTMIENSRDRTPPDAKSRIAAQFERAFGLNIRGKLFFCNHHIAHAWSAFAFAGFDRSLILTLDGDGDDSSGMVLVCDGRELTVLRDFSISQSLGDVYQNLIKILGYHRFDEYKAMGLAPYGNPERFRSLFETCYKLLPDGNYSLEPLNTWFKCFDLAGLIVQARRSGAPFLQIHKDFAAALQEMLERIALHVLQYFSKTTNEKCLCLAGGVAHNCTMNGRILYSRLFEKVFVQPAAHDAGGALGAAMCAWYSKHTQAKPKRLAHIYWGSDTGSDDAVEEMLRPWSQFISYTREDLISAKAAKLLADGAVVGWIQGRQITNQFDGQEARGVPAICAICFGRKDVRVFRCDSGSNRVPIHGVCA